MNQAIQALTTTLQIYFAASQTVTLVVT